MALFTGGTIIRSWKLANPSPCEVLEENVWITSRRLSPRANLSDGPRIFASQLNLFHFMADI